MGKGNLETEIQQLQNQLFAISDALDQVWMYHPSNPDFVNPITLYSKLKNDIKEIERKICDLEFLKNSLN